MYSPSLEFVRRNSLPVPSQFRRRVALHIRYRRRPLRVRAANRRQIKLLVFDSDSAAGIGISYL